MTDRDEQAEYLASGAAQAESEAADANAKAVSHEHCWHQEDFFVRCCRCGSSSTADEETKAEERTDCYFIAAQANEARREKFFADAEFVEETKRAALSQGPTISLEELQEEVRFPELLAEAAEAVRLKAVCDRCQGTGRDEVDFGCDACGGGQTASGSGLNPDYAALRNVLLEKCPCGLVTHPVSSWLPYEEFAPICKTCYLRGRHGEGCYCGGTGYIPRRDWEELRRQGIKGAFAGAIATIELGGIGYAVELDVFDSDDADTAALEAVKEAIG